MIAFFAGVICGVLILGFVSVGSRKEREMRAYQQGLEDGKKSLE